MRFRCLTPQQRLKLKADRFLEEDKTLSKWHHWFAWRPIRLSSDGQEVRWLEKVYRKSEKYETRYGWCREWKYAESELDILKLGREAME
jgi:hypothetical protein